VRVGKKGYYPSKDNNTFEYGDPFNHFTPDQHYPVIFRLRKKGPGENLISIKRNYGLPRDGSPVGIDLETGKTINGGGSFIVQCWTEDRGKERQKYDWHCLITIPGGGLVLNDDPFPFQAPEKGYIPTNQITFVATRSNWTSDVDVNFYYQLADGNYGRTKFSMIAGGDNFCMIASLLNPTGSRNLEPVQ